VGGTLNVENPFIAKARLRSLRKYLPISMNHIKDTGCEVAEDVFWDTELSDNSSSTLSENRLVAIEKMAEIEKIYKSLPHLDCGSCGAPNCHALAEDIIKGDAKYEDCLIQLRDKQQ
jgi:ArsR family metal-binding transcriptional regulator